MVGTPLIGTARKQSSNSSIDFLLWPVSKPLSMHKGRANWCPDFYRQPYWLRIRLGHVPIQVVWHSVQRFAALDYFAAKSHYFTARLGVYVQDSVRVRD
jgi:hypothetical protein